MIKGIIYDMDDLMVNSNPLQAKTTEVVLKRFGRSRDELPADMVNSFIGKRLQDNLPQIIDYLKLDISVEDFSKEREDIFRKLIDNELEVMPGLYQSLELFKAHKYPIAIASSAVKTNIDLVLKKFNIENYFSVIISGDDVNKGKPDPEPYLIAAQKLNLEPKNCLVLEDATSGIDSAKAAGCKCIAVINNNTPPQDRSRADKIINSLEELNLDMIKALY